jgi:hypothetical protein
MIEESKEAGREVREAHRNAWLKGNDEDDGAWGFVVDSNKG